MSVSLGLHSFHAFLSVDPREHKPDLGISILEKKMKPSPTASISFLLNPQDEDSGLEVTGLFALAEMRNSHLNQNFYSSSSSLASLSNPSSPPNDFSPLPKQNSFLFRADECFSTSPFYSRSDDFPLRFQTQIVSEPQSCSLPNSPSSSFSAPLPNDSNPTSTGRNAKRSRSSTKDAQLTSSDSTNSSEEDPRQSWNFYQKGGSREVKDPFLGKVVRSYLACSEKKRGCPAELVVSVTNDDISHFKPNNCHNHLPPKRIRVKKCAKTH